MKVTLIKVPYHLNRENVGLGRGPTRFLEAGADRYLAERGFEVEVEAVRSSAPSAQQLEVIAEVDAQVAALVREAVAGGRFPLVLSGNCNSSLGTLAGLRPSEVGIVWFDAHGDYNTPETTVSGFFDGMGLAVATGRCHHEIRTRIGLDRPVPEAHTILAGVRDLDRPERDLLLRTAVRMVPGEEIKERGLEDSLSPALDALRAQVTQVYLHVDVDVLDPEQAPANEYNAPDGLSVQELESAIRMVGEQFRIRAAALTAYNPDYDSEGRTVRAGLRLMQVMAEAAQG